jgi:multicomponent Na+:H+ antiporter subunit A
MTTLILQTITRVVTPVVLLLSAYLLWRGHDSPGGGFIGALVAGAAVVLTYLAYGSEGVDRMLPLRSETLLSAGLLIALGMGLGGIVAGGDFLEGAVVVYHPPVIGEFKLAASFVFDIGVLLIVLAVIVAIVRYLGESHEGDEQE